MLKLVGISAVISATLLTAIGATAQKSAPSSKLYLDRLADQPASSSVILSAWTGPVQNPSVTPTTEDAPRWITRPVTIELRSTERGSSRLVMSTASLVTAAR